MVSVSLSLDGFGKSFMGWFQKNLSLDGFEWSFNRWKSLHGNWSVQLDYKRVLLLIYISTGSGIKCNLKDKKLLGY